MKFIATLILNAIVTLGLIAFCFNYLLKPYIQSEKELMKRVIGQKANYAHFVGIDEKVDELNAELNEQKNLTKTRTASLLQRISKLEKLLPKFQKTKPNASQAH